MASFSWQENLCVEQQIEPCILVIFGASGDLTRKKLIPALYSLYRKKLLSAPTRIIGCGRSPLSPEEFRSLAAERLPEKDAGFLELFDYFPMEYGSMEDGKRLSGRLAEYEKAIGRPLPHLFYMALPAGLYIDTVNALCDAGLLEEKDPRCWRHAVFEKPFGYDRKSAAELDRALHRCLAEHQIYRIDHYLGKETVQNIFMLRFSNLIFEPLWNAQYIDSVQITVCETAGIGRRAGYFDRAGLLRDMFQNHMLEMLSLAAMECPREFSGDAVRSEKLKLLQSIRPFDRRALKEAVRGQYAGYEKEPGIAPGSQTETYVALRLWIDSWRWHGVPFYLRSGKGVAEDRSEIDVVFKSVPHSIFPGVPPGAFQKDVLHLHVRPQEGLSLTLQAKKPGPRLCMGALTLNYDYADNGGIALDAYARLLLDCAAGDQTLFVRSDAVDCSWRLLEPLLDYWKTSDTPPPERYALGSSGPETALHLPERDGRRWEDDSLGVSEARRS